MPAAWVNSLVSIRPANPKAGQASKSPLQFDSTLDDDIMLESTINAARLAIRLVDQNWTNLTQKGFHIAWQNGPVSLWRNLPTLDAVREQISSDYVNFVGTAV